MPKTAKKELTKEWQKKLSVVKEESKKVKDDLESWMEQITAQWQDRFTSSEEENAKIISELQSNIEQNQRVIEETHQADYKKDEIIAALSENIENLNTTLKQKDQIDSEKDGAMSVLKKELESYKESIKSMKLEMCSLNDLLISKDGALKEIQSELQTVNNTINDTEEIIKNMEEDYEKKSVIQEDQIEHLVSEIESLKDTFTETEQMYASQLQSLNATLESKESEHKIEIEFMNQITEEDSNNIVEQSQEIQRLQETKGFHMNTISVLEDKLSGLNEKVMNLLSHSLETESGYIWNEPIDELMHQYISLGEKVKESDQQNEEYESEKVDYENALDALKQEDMEKKQMIDMLHDKINNLEQSIKVEVKRAKEDESLKHQEKQKKIELSLKQENKAMKKQIKAITFEYDECAKTNAFEKEKVTSFKSKLRAMNDNLKHSEVECKKIKEGFTKQNQLLQNTVLSQKREIEELCLQVKICNKELEQLKSMQEKLHQNKGKSEENMLKASSQISLLQKKLIAAEQRYNELNERHEKELKIKYEEAAQMSSETDSLRNMLKQTTKSLKKQISDYKKEIENIQIEAKNNASENEELKRKIDDQNENESRISYQEFHDENDCRISNQTISRKKTRDQLKRRTDRIKAIQQAERENLTMLDAMRHETLD